jgi:hypothetical protein
MHPLVVALVSVGYIAWFLFSDKYRRLPPDALPAFPVWLFYAPVLFFCRLCGVRQEPVWEQPLLPHRRYLVVCLPHGAYAFSGVFFIAPQWRLTTYREYRNISPVLIGVASVLFYIPIVRELILFLGGRDIDKKNIKAILDASPRCNMTMIPGGIWEQIHTDSTEERHYVQARLGFIRLAFELGFDIVPMYGFGENQLFTTHQYLKAEREWVLRKFKAGIALCTGKFGCTLLPLASKVTHVYGRAISLERFNTKNPTEEQLLEVYALYKAEVLRLFKKHAENLLPPEVAEKGIKVIRRGVDYDDRDSSSAPPSSGEKGKKAN